jgi:hypothetical protein
MFHINTLSNEDHNDMILDFKFGLILHWVQWIYPGNIS